MKFDKEKMRESLAKLKISAALGVLILASKAKEKLISIKAEAEDLANPEHAMDALLNEKIRLLKLGGLSEEEAKKSATRQVKEKINNLGKGEEHEVS